MQPGSRAGGGRLREFRLVHLPGDLLYLTGEPAETEASGRHIVLSRETHQQILPIGRGFASTFVVSSHHTRWALSREWTGDEDRGN